MAARRPRRAAVALLVVIAAGFVPRPAPAPAQPLEDRAAIQELLMRRADAVMARDKRAFMATMDNASTSFVESQRRLFVAMRRVPFSSYELRAKWSAWGDLVRPGDLAHYPGAEEVTIPLTEERYRIRGLDRAPAIEDLYYSFVKRDGRWLIAGDRDVEDFGFVTARHLWDFGPVQVQRLGRFMLLRHPCRDGSACARLPDGVESLLGGGIARALGYWSGPWPKRIGVLVPTTMGELRQVLQTSFDLSEYIAFTSSSVDDGRYSAPRMVLNWRTLENRSATSIESVFAHELIHVGTRSSAGPFVPIFVEEGFADHAANQGSAASLAFFDLQRAAGAVDGTIPEDFEFTTGTGSAIFLNYQAAQSAVSFFVRTWGAPAFEHFYKRLGAQRSVPGTTRFQVSKALKRTIGIGLGGFERAWAGSLGL